MKKLETIVTPLTLDTVKRTFADAGIVGLTVTEVQTDLLPKMKIEVAVSDAQAEEVLELIAHAARTGIIDESPVFVSSLDEAVAGPRADDGEHGTGSTDGAMSRPGRERGRVRGAPGQSVDERRVLDAIPALVDRLVAARPGHVYRDVEALVLRAALGRALAITGGNQIRAARLLGMNRNTLRKHCSELDLVPTRQGKRHPAGEPRRTGSA
jgi:nitrogen regulatory protein PII/DNA-binding protein Fis